MKTIIINNEQTNYLISENGEIFNIKSKSKLQTHIIKCGYVLAQLNHKGKKYNRYVHRLVAEAYCDLDVNNKKYEVDHIDSNRLNNNYLNLRVVTRAENMKILWKEKGDEIRKNMRGIKKTFKKMKRIKIKHTDCYGNLITIYPTIDEACKTLNMSKSALNHRLNYKFDQIIAWREKGRILLWDGCEGCYVDIQQIKKIEDEKNIKIKVCKYQPKRYFVDRFYRIFE